MSVLSLIALVAPDARACGGFACSAFKPVVQSGEQIVFGLDPEENEVEMHVQISYTGPSSDFSWIVPVPTVPDLFLSSSLLFPLLQQATQPLFDLRVRQEGHCRTGDGFQLFGNLAEFNQPPDPNLVPPSGTVLGSVAVVSEQAVGPYETVTLQASSADGLLTWLTDNGYDIPSDFDAVLAPYIAQDAYFVALKLRKNQDVGDLAPLGLRYPATKAMVPVQLTSVSAAPDMRMEAYILSDTRAVPESYYHVRINDAAIDWWQQGSNYDDVITVAANEAGGHAFATDYYGDTDIVPTLWVESAYDRARLLSADSAEEWLAELTFLAPSLELFSALEEILGLLPGQGQGAWSCPACFDPVAPFGATTATHTLEERIIEPLRNAQRLLDRYPKLTRMTSSLDAIEMTVDPIFVLNPDMREQYVPRTHEAKLVYDCNGGKRRDKAPRALDLSDGRHIVLPSEREMQELGMSDFQYIEELGDRKAQIIEQMGASGPPEIIADFTGELFDQVAAFNGLAGCGCDTRTGAGSLVGVLGGLLGMTVRRRRS